MISVIRSLWIYAHMLALTVLYAGTVALAALLGYRNPERLGRECARRWGRGILRASGTPVTVEGLEHVRPDRAQILISNHESWYDIFALATYVPGPLRFVGKKELARMPVFGPGFRAAGHIFVDRGDHASALQSMALVSERIRREPGTVVILPEGTRTRTGQLLPFKKGAFVLAIQSQVPIIPAAVAGSRAVLPKGRFRIHPGPIHMAIGEPIETRGMTPADRDRLLAISRGRVTELRARAAAALAARGEAREGAREPRERFA
ncbi:MAG: 1-acyl-sn-glycerol-3-phosphate acyltransferase [Gemmatimonadetes bacterium]|nr:1-acyl-sn-glycerol-3-phosphate acyltransferase [Gemmatimonadota bacterium]